MDAPDKDFKSLPGAFSWAKEKTGRHIKGCYQ